MLSEQDFADWANRMDLPDETLSVVAHIRASNPARRPLKCYRSLPQQEDGSHDPV